MTQKNIDTMDMIVSLLAQHKKISKALKHVYDKRHLIIPHNEKWYQIHVIDLGMTKRTTNALMRAHLTTLQDIIDYCQESTIKDIKALGQTSGVELLETILDVCWNNMTEQQRVDFLIDTVERNECNLRKEIQF
jgi:DNA-directed RNA polymerase alpha subunit